jgi:hypothetical protein
MSRLPHFRRDRDNTSCPKNMYIELERQLAQEALGLYWQSQSWLAGWLNPNPQAGGFGRIARTASPRLWGVAATRTCAGGLLLLRRGGASQRESEERAAGGRNGRSGSREVHSSARGTQLAARGPSGNRRPFAKIYTRRHTENSNRGHNPPREKMPKWRMKANGLIRPKTGEMPEREPTPRGGENNRGINEGRRTGAVSQW